MAITKYTENAAVEEAEDKTNYVEILEELMDGRSLRQFADEAGMFSHTLWGAMKAGKKDVNKFAKNRLREMVGLPLLSLTPAEMVADMDPNARTYRTGTEAPNALWLWNTHESSVNPVTGPCNQVTRQRRSHSKRYISKWHELPTETLAECIKNRVVMA